MLDAVMGPRVPWAFDGRRPHIRARSRALARLGRVTRGAATVTLRVGIELERRAVEPVLASPEVSRLLTGAIDGRRVQAAFKTVLDSDGAKQLVATFFDSGLFDELADRLLASEALWRLVDEIAASPSVTAAITQQSLGFADQVGDEVRSRSRGADDWLERAARRLARRRTDRVPLDAPGPDPIGP